MMPVNHVQSCVSHFNAGGSQIRSMNASMLRSGSKGASVSNRMLTAVDLTATVVIALQYLKVTYSPFKRRPGGPTTYAP